jgi:lysophospholipase L1-like esterase
MSSAATPVFLMGSMGDSISAGFFADTDLRDFAAQVNRGPGSGWFEHKDSYSWASGDEISSHFEKLRNAVLLEEPGAELEVQNFAASGNVAENIPDQAEEIVQAMHDGNYRAVKYITLFIGANDACSTQTSGGTPDDEMAQSLMKGFEALSQIEQSEPIRVLVVGLPKIPSLAEANIRESSTLLGLSCHFVRDEVLGTCHSLLDWKNDGEYFEKLGIVADKNAVIQSVTETAAQAFPNLQIHYTARLWNVEIKPEQLAIDCFHPGRLGQQVLADELWAEQPWF